jgi:hypothetical protein
LISVTGQVVAAGTADRDVTIDVRQLPSGVYQFVTPQGSVMVVKR